jgi:hypothetical protein
MNKIQSTLIDTETGREYPIEVRINTQSGVDVNFIREDGHYRAGAWIEIYDGKACVHSYRQAEDGYEKDEPENTYLFEETDLIPAAEIGHAVQTREEENSETAG